MRSKVTFALLTAALFALPVFDPASYAEYAGNYEFRPGQTRAILHENGKLLIET